MSADVVHLQTEQVADAMREEHGGQAGGHGSVGAAADNALIAQDLGDHPVGGRMDIGIVSAGTDEPAHAQLRRIQRLQKLAKASARHRCMRSGDVAGITAELGAGVDQHRVAHGGQIVGEDEASLIVGSVDYDTDMPGGYTMDGIVYIVPGMGI